MGEAPSLRGVPADARTRGPTVRLLLDRALCRVTAPGPSSCSTVAGCARVCQAELVVSVEEFLAERPRLFGVAYRMLGEANEAEDVVQDAYLRWTAVEHAEIFSASAWLTRGSPICV